MVSYFDKSSIRINSQQGLFICTWLAKLACFLAVIPLAKYGALHFGYTVRARKTL